MSTQLSCPLLTRRCVRTDELGHILLCATRVPSIVTRETQIKNWIKIGKSIVTKFLVLWVSSFSSSSSFYCFYLSSKTYFEEVNSIKGGDGAAKKLRHWTAVSTSCGFESRPTNSTFYSTWIILGSAILLQLVYLWKLRPEFPNGEFSFGNGRDTCIKYKK